MTMTAAEAPDGRARARAELLGGSPYQGYLYAYPHKTAYRAFEPPLSLERLWADEPDRVFLYIHVPFCEMRCGFCNLFTKVGAAADEADAFLAALEREAEAAAAALGGRRIARMAIGGGTPTYLSSAQLHRLFDVAERLGAPLGALPVSCEASPATATPERLAVLEARGVTRLSLGVESFSDQAAKALGRPQRAGVVAAALDAAKAAAFASLNLDLIYGGQSQSLEEWDADLTAALAAAPNELYLYPLYVRVLTGLSRRAGEAAAAWDARRLAAYRHGRDRLRAAGWRQRSMRHFSRAAIGADFGDYCCQEDGMIGLGPGARSYTERVHYASPFAVGRHAVAAIIAEYVGRSAEAFGFARHGARLGLGERRRRDVLKSLLQADGLDLARYARRFGAPPEAHLLELAHLAPLGLARRTPDRLILTDLGLERSDAVGPWLISPATRAAMEAHEWV